MGVKLVGGGSAAVELRLGRVPAAAFHQHAEGAGAQEPHSGVHQAKIIFRQLPDFGGGRFLEEEGQFGGMPARGAENAEVTGAFRGEPHAQAEHVHLGKGRQFAREPQEDVAAGDHGGDAGRGMGQDALVIGQLQVEQRLVQALAARPADDGNGHEQFADQRISRQAPALAARMKNQLAAGIQPIVEGLRRGWSDARPGPVGWPCRRRSQAVGRGDRRRQTIRAAGGPPTPRTPPPCAGATSGDIGLESRFGLSSSLAADVMKPRKPSREIPGGSATVPVAAVGVPPTESFSRNWSTCRVNS